MYTVSKQNLSIHDGSSGEIILRGAPGHHFFYHTPCLMASRWFLLTSHFYFEQGLSENIDSISAGFVTRFVGESIQFCKARKGGVVYDK